MPAIRPTGKVIPYMVWMHATTGNVAGIGSANPGIGEDAKNWSIVNDPQDRWTIRWPDGTTGIGQVPFTTQRQAQEWVDEHPRFPGMNQG